MCPITSGAVSDNYFLVCSLSEAEQFSYTNRVHFKRHLFRGLTVFGCGRVVFVRPTNPNGAVEASHLYGSEHAYLSYIGLLAILH